MEHEWMESMRRRVWSPNRIYRLSNHLRTFIRFVDIDSSSEGEDSEMLCFFVCFSLLVAPASRHLRLHGCSLTPSPIVAVSFEIS